MNNTSAYEVEAYWAQYEEPQDGESYDGSGDIRPVPAGVPMRPDN